MPIAAPNAPAGLCATGAISNSPASDFPQSAATFNSGINAFLDGSATKFSAATSRSLDFANGIAAGAESSGGDFTAAGSDCPANGCAFPVDDSTTSFALRLRGFLSVPTAWTQTTVHFGLFCDDGASLTLFDAAGNDYQIVTRPPALGAPAFRSTAAVTFPSPGLYPIEILYTQITSVAILEVSTLEGQFTDFELPANQAGSTDLATAGFALLDGNLLLQSEGATGGGCVECAHANAGTTAGCPAGQFCDSAALCEPCDTFRHCGPSCAQCPGETRVCLAGACVQCAGDNDCSSGGTCETSSHTCTPPPGPDLAVQDLPPQPKGCGCTVGAARQKTSRGPFALFSLFGILALLGCYAARNFWLRKFRRATSRASSSRR